MKINYSKFLKETDFTVDKELLERIEYKEILFIISQEIIEYREKHNLKQSDLADKLKMSQVMISKIESGTYNPTIKLLVKMWNALSCENVNFGANLLKKIYDKVVNNYNFTINVEMNNNAEVEEYEFKTKNSNVLNAVYIRDKEETSFIPDMDLYEMAS